jgi:two-component system nitrate/nitrite response regulator NarL
MVNSGDVAVRCVIVDDSRRFVDAAGALLERQGFQVVGVAANGDEAVELSRRLMPDVILLDVDLGDESGFEVARRLVRSDTASPIILISTHTELDFRELVAESPALGFLPKSELSAAAIRNMLTAAG